VVGAGSIVEILDWRRGKPERKEDLEQPNDTSIDDDNR
jgi:hypothetical protein